MSRDCIIEAGIVLCGIDDDGKVGLRHDVGIRVQGGMIAQIGPLEAVGFGHDCLPQYGSRDMIAMPGLINSHHHFGLTPLMMGVPFAPLELWLPQFRRMRGVGTRLDTLFAAIDMLESGTTSVHHIASGLPGERESWGEARQTVLNAYEEAGMRVAYSFMMRDRNLLSYEDDSVVLDALPEEARAWLEPQLLPAKIPADDHMSFHKDGIASANQVLVRHNLAPSNLHWCSDQLLQSTAETARHSGAQVHMHLLETERQAIFAWRRYGCTAIEHLDRIGFLGTNVTLGHANWATEGDLDRLAGCGCAVCHNASSGLRLSSGIAPVNQMRKRGIPVALGIDQSNIADDRDMLLEMKLAWALHRETGLFTERPDAGAILRMATQTGAATLGFGGEVGRLEPGQRADLVLMSRSAVAAPYVDPEIALTDILLHRAMRRHIDKVFVDGRLVVDGGRVTGIDRDGILQEIGKRLAYPQTESEKHGVRMVTELMPVLERMQRAFVADLPERPYRYNGFDPRDAQ